MTMAGGGGKNRCRPFEGEGDMIGRAIVRPIFRLAVVWGAAAPSAARDTHRIARAGFANNAP